VGGPRVRAEQLDQLVQVLGLPNVSLRVAPFSARANPEVMSGRFVILRFPAGGDGRDSEPATVYKDGFTGALYLDKPQEVERYTQAFQSIRDACLVASPPTASCGGAEVMSRNDLLWRSVAQECR